MGNYSNETRPVSDDDLTRRLREVLAAQHTPSLRELLVEMHLGTLVVSGTVPTFYAKQLAWRHCRQVAGAHRVKANIKVA